MKKNIIRMLMMFVAILTANTVLAENKLWIEPQNDGRLAIMMDNEPTAAALQFNLVVPEGCSLVYTFDEKDPLDETKWQYIFGNDDRLPKGTIVQSSKKRNLPVYTCIVASLNRKPLIGTSGPIAYFTMQKSTEKPIEIKLENIIVSNKDGKKLEAPSNYSGEFQISTTDIEVYASYANNTVYVNPGTSFTFPVSLRNSNPVNGIQMDIQLPAGCSFTEDDVELVTGRVSATSTLSFTAGSDNTYRLILVDAVSNMVVPEEGNGVIMNINVNVAENVASQAPIIIKNVTASVKNISVKGIGCNLTAISGADAKTKADAEVKALRDALAAAQTKIAAECPNVKDKFTGEAIATAIETLEHNIQTAYDNKTLTPNYDEVMAPAAAIKADIEKLVADAAAAEAAEVKRQADNKAAYDAVLATIAELEKALEDAVAVVDSEYADYKDAVADKIQAMTTTLGQAKVDAQAELDKVATQGNYAYSVDKAALLSEINAIVVAAQAAKDQAAAEAEAARQAENKAAYETDLASIEQLYANYRATVAEIQKDYKDFEDAGAENAVKNDIDAAKAEVEKAYKAVATEGKYQSPIDVEALQASIDKLLADAKQAKADKDTAEAEAKRQADNKAAYDKVIVGIQALQNKLNEAQASLSAYPAYDGTEAVAAIQAQINALTSAADAALAAVANEGNFTYTVDGTPVEKAIADMLAAAKAAQDKADADAEAARQAENKAAYDAVLASLAEIQKNMDATVAQIKADYADYEDAAAEAAVQGKIDAAKAAAEAAFKAVEKEGKFAYTVDAAGLNADIKALLDAAIAAKKAAADEAEAKRQANNLKLYNADKEAIAKVMADYIATVKEIQTNYKDYEDAKAEELVKMEIETAEKNIENAYRAVTNEGDYKSPVDFAALNASVAKLLQDAKDAKVKAEEEAAAAEQKRQDDNKAAYEADLAKVADLMAKYRAVVDEIQNNYADYEDSKAEFAVLDEINAAKAAVEEAYKAVEKAGNYATPVDFAALEASIDKLLADAQQKKADEEKAEADRQERNKAAYEADLAAIETLTANLEAAVALIQKDYAEFEDAEAEKAVADAIAAAKAEVEAAYALVEKEGEYKSPLNAEALQAAIDKLVADAKAGQAAKDAEAERQARNLAQYNIVIGQISELKAELTAACLKIDTDFNGWNYSEAAAEIQKALDEAREGADAAYAAVEKEGEFDFTFDTDAIRAMIAKMVEDAELGVDSIEAEAGEAIYFTLDGKRHERPVQGEVNVIVRKNGKTEKVMVK